MRKFLPSNHIIFTPENPMHPTKYGKNPSIEDVTKFLNSTGEDAQIIEGHYGQPERSILVAEPKNPKGIMQLATDFGQESAIHSQAGNHKMHFLNGPKTGTHVSGQGTNFFQEKPDSNFSKIHTVDGPLYFSHNFDFDKSEKLIKAPMPYSSYDISEAEPLRDPENIPGYKKIKEVKLPNGLIYRQHLGSSSSVDPHARHHTLYDDTGKHPLSYMNTSHVEDPMAEAGHWPHQVKYAEVSPEFRGKGLGRQLYLASLVHGTKRLTSDSLISPESHKAWKSFGSMPGLGLKLGRYSAKLPPVNEQAAYYNDRHELFIKNPKELNHDKMFPKVDVWDKEKLAASEKPLKTLDSIRSSLEMPEEIETIDIPEHLQIQWAVPFHRWK